MLVLAPFLAVSVLVAPGQEYPKRSPFEAVRWPSEVPEVLVSGRWHVPRRIAGHEIRRVVDFCRETWPDKATKRFEEDLVEVLTRLGGDPGTEVDLELLDIERGAVVMLRGVAMTKENRRRIHDAARTRDDGAGASSVNRVQREHPTLVPESYREWTRVSRVAGGTDVDRAAACEDLDELEWLIEHEYAYRDRLGFDYRAAFDAIRVAVGERIPSRAFAILLQKALARFGDGHTRMDEATGALGNSFLPCLVEPHGNALLAVRGDRAGFVDEEHPVLQAIDGVDVGRWIVCSAALEARGAPTFVRRRAARGLRNLEWVREELDFTSGSKSRAAKGRVQLSLSSLDGRATKTVDVEIARNRPVYGQRIRGESRRLDGDVGYVRIASMEDDDAFLDALDQDMLGFRDTRGLVIDVRGNGGGSRAALLRLFPYFLSTEDEPHVANVAACRIGPRESRDAREGLLSDRYLFPSTSARWSARDLAAIASAADTFVPEWRPRVGDFSPWHWLVLRRSDNSRAFSYTKPVVILLDADCFSATDVFLAAFAGRPRITLLGESSGGGSGRAISRKLARSGLTVRLSSMISFRVDGRSIDGRGIDPDVVVRPAPADFVGRGDAQLDAALARLR